MNENGWTVVEWRNEDKSHTYAPGHLMDCTGKRQMKQKVSFLKIGTATTFHYVLTGAKKQGTSQIKKGKDLILFQNTNQFQN